MGGRPTLAFTRGLLMGLFDWFFRKPAAGVWGWAPWVSREAICPRCCVRMRVPPGTPPGQVVFCPHCQPGSPGHPMEIEVSGTDPKEVESVARTLAGPALGHHRPTEPGRLEPSRVGL